MASMQHRSPEAHQRLVRDQRVRITVFAERHPELVELWVTLTGLLVTGDEIVMAPPSLDPGVLALQLACGEMVASPRITVEHGQLQQCHRNAARLFVAGRATAILSGWALGPGDGLWHQHSSGWRGPLPTEGDPARAGSTLVETTMPRDRYFGVFLTGLGAWAHATANLGTRGALTQASPARLRELHALLTELDPTAVHGEAAAMLDAYHRLGDQQ